MRRVSAALLALVLPLLMQSPSSAAVDANCSYNGICLHGKVKVVKNFGDIKVMVVRNFPDLRVQKVKYFPEHCGQWQFVDNFPDFTIQYVNAFPDITIQYVKNFPGLP